jgi:type II secretion system protein L
MSTRVYVRLDRDAAVPGKRCEWVLRDRRGAELKRGVGLLESLPRADAVIGVLAHDLVLIRAIELPPGRRARTPAALANAMEPYLLSDPATNHVVGLASLPNGKTLIAALARTWLNACLTAFANAHRPLVAMTIESSLIAVEPGSAVAVCHADGGFVVSANTEPMALDAAAEGDVPAGLASYLRDPSLRGIGSLRVYHPSSRLSADTWERALGVSVTTLGAWDWRRATDPANGFNPKTVPDVLAALARESTDDVPVLRRFQVPVALAASIVVLHFSLTAVHWYMQRAERDRLRAEIETHFRQSVSSTEPLVDPLLQTERALVAAQRQAGLYAAQDFIALLSRLAAESAGLPPVRTLNYSESVLTCEWRAPDAAAVERVASQLRAKGFTAEITSGPAGARLALKAATR